MGCKESASAGFALVGLAGRVQDARDQGHPHEFRQARGLHFRHEIGAVDLNRPRADCEIERNDLGSALGVEIPEQEPVLHYSRRLALYIWSAELAEPMRSRQRIPAQAVPTG